MDIITAAEKFYDEFYSATDYEGITGTSVWSGPEGVGILVHIRSSEGVLNEIPDSYVGFKLYKKLEQNEKY